MKKIRVLRPGGDRFASFQVTPEEARRMIRRHQAIAHQGGHMLRLLEAGESIPLRRTRISSGGVMAAIGMSQVYTTRNDKHRVDGFKWIAPEDRKCFAPGNDE